MPWPPHVHLFRWNAYDAGDSFSSGGASGGAHHLEVYTRIQNYVTTWFLGLSTHWADFAQKSLLLMGFSHTIEQSVTSACFFTHCVGLNVTAAGLTLLEGKRETFSQGCSYISQLGFSVLFVCFSYKPCWYICMIMHFWRCSWMGPSPFCLYSGLRLSQLCIGQRPKFCCLFCANSFHWLLDNTEALGAANGCVCLGTELKTQSVSC